MSYPTDSRGRYLRMPTPLKRKSTLMRKSERQMNLIEEHKRFISWYKQKLGLTDYGLLWLIFCKGIILALIIERLILH